MRDRKKVPGAYNFPVRFWICIAIAALMFLYLAFGLVDLQLVNNESYSEQANAKKSMTITLRGSRGMITDAESVILAQDELVYNITFYRDGSQNSKSEYAAFTQSIMDTIRIIEENGGSLCVESVIERDPETGEWRFNFGSGVSESVLETREKQWRNNHYLTASKYATAQSCIDMLKERYRMTDMTLDEDMMLKIMAVYSEMQMNLFNSQPITIASNVSFETVMEIEAKSMQLNGMGVEIGTRRVYPKGTLAAQVIGYTGAITSYSYWSDTLKPLGYKLADKIGIDGIEYAMEDWLTQNTSTRSGYRVVEKNNQGSIVNELEYVEPTDGNNVKLTINMNYQQAAEDALGEAIDSIRIKEEQLLTSDNWIEDNKEEILSRNWAKYPISLANSGAMMVADLEGRVLAMASLPNYDLNAMVAGGKSAMAINADNRGLLRNNNIHLRGAPGSIFKMCTALAALCEGELSPYETISDAGKFTAHLTSTADYASAPQCWAGNATRLAKHQNQTIVEGLQNSCNYFFYTLGFRLGEDRLYKYASLLGLTTKTGLEVKGELRSIVGNQNSLYDTTKPVAEQDQDTSRAIIVFNSLKSFYTKVGAKYGITYDNDRLSSCCIRLMNMAVNYGQSVWVSHMRSILMEELNMTRDMVYLASNITDAYNYLNDIKWGGEMTIMTAIGQGITLLTPAAVTRYVLAIANGGTVYNLMLVDSITSPDGDLLRQCTPSIYTVIDGASDYIQYIWRGMKGVVDEDGTAGKYFSTADYELAGKTGTAQNSRVDLENNAWFVCYAPYENPEIVLAVYVPNGYSGGLASTAARSFLDWYMEYRELDSTVTTLPLPNTLAP